MPVINKQGYQVTFECKYCGKEYTLSEMIYDSYDNFRVCNKCRDKLEKDRHDAAIAERGGK